MFVFNFRCTSSSGVPHSEGCENGQRVCRASVSDAGALRLASDTEALQVPNARVRSVGHPERNRDLALEAFDTQIPVYSLPSCERSLFVRDDKAWDAVQLCPGLCARD